ncbi:hypothetical protein SAMN05444280_106118 [Tangfeifania diversioriginum]|uniref:Tetratricopeptide repeat-containing protein n=1 Tax=Tangfeifania diversioriginum TaxID=1168035 RepID=A0A1M6EA41_9BACT|nr:DUF6340 family protein [Tangfeifania diversioriginum]SHI82220.1 hypothetical protein SAMN05444280_106118 [Tangfeifania diversioriginum]
MKSSVKLLSAGLAAMLLLSGCNTLNNIQTIDLEVFVPASIVFPPEYKNVAVRYNNSNAQYNPWFAEYSIESVAARDTTNIDSIASEIYFREFLETLKYQNFFDTIVYIEPGNYKETRFSDELIKPDSLTTEDETPGNLSTRELSSILTTYPADSLAANKITLDPDLGLYSKNKLQQIADTTQCDILLSFDLFSSLDGIGYNPELDKSYHLVFNMAFWNFYDLSDQELQYFYNRVDTISWQSDEITAFASLQKLPQREKALKEAAQISAISFAEFLVPHWELVQRMYYKSGNSGLRKTDKFISEGKWLEAAAIWKANIENKNDRIAAKSMFNMALASEMEGYLDAAIDWAVKSYHVFGEENKLHAENCKDYIRILSTRKRDLKIIEKQIKL